MLILVNLICLGTVWNGSSSAAGTPLSETIVAACNNTFSPAKFPLTFDVKSTVTSPADPSTISPGDSFTVEFDVTANLAASFKTSAYAIIGPRPVPISEARATIGVLSGATGPILSVGTGVTGGFSTVNIPAPGRSVTASLTELSTTAVAAPGTFVPTDIGSFIIDIGATEATGPGITITAVNGDGSQATLSLPAAATAADIPVQIWSPDDVTDSPIPIGTVSGTFTADSTAAPFTATFQLLGNSTATGDTPVGFSSNATTNDPRTGTEIVANSSVGFSPVTNAAKQTYLRASIALGVAPYLPCMGGSWTQLADGYG